MTSHTAAKFYKLFFDYLNTYSKLQHSFNLEMWSMVFDFNYHSDNILLIHLVSFETLDIITVKYYLKTVESIISTIPLNTSSNIITHIDILDQFYCIDEDNHIIITNSSVSTPEINEHYISEIFNTYVDYSREIQDTPLSEENKQMFINKILSQINNTDIHTGPEPIALPIPSF